MWLVHAGAADWFVTCLRLRDLVSQTGRWPLAVTNVIPGWHLSPSPGRRDLRPGRVMGRLATIEVPVLLDELERDELTEPLEQWLDFHLLATEALCGHAPSVEEVRAAVGETPVEMAVERWLLGWERRHCPDASREGVARYLDWFEPGGDIDDPSAAAARTLDCFRLRRALRQRVARL